MKRKVLSALLTGAMALTMVLGTGVTVSAAETETEAAETEAAEAETAYTGKTDYKIAFSQCTLASPFYVSMKDGAEEYAKELGIDFTYVDAGENVEKQNQDVTDLITSGIDCLILNPVNSDGLTAAIEQCNQAGIPVITVDRNVSEGQKAYVGRDNYTMAHLVGEELVDKLGKDATGTVLEIQGTAGDSVMMQRRDGFEDALKELAPGLTIVQSAYCDYTRSKAVTATQDLIQANDDIVAIYGHNDDMSLGASQVLQENGIEGVTVCGVDGLMEAVSEIPNGNYAITAMNDPMSLGKAAINTALKVLNDEKYDEFVDAGTGIINESNAADYIDEKLAFAAAK